MKQPDVLTPGEVALSDAHPVGMAELVVTKCVGDLDVGDVGSGRRQPSLRDGIHTDSAYPALKRGALVKPPADDFGSRNDMRSGLSNFFFVVRKATIRPKTSASAADLPDGSFFEKETWMDSRHVTSSKKVFHDERQCESDRENHQEIL